MAAGVRVVIVLPADLTTFRVGGIQSFVEGFIRFAPDDFELMHVGIAGPGAGHSQPTWASGEIAGRQVWLLPMITVADLHRRPRIPLSLRFSAALYRRRGLLPAGPVVLQFHRPGTALALLGTAQPKVQVLHLSSAQLLSAASESRWRRLGAALPFVERLTLPRMDAIAIVEEGAARSYRQRFPRLANRISFVPNWFDDTIFIPFGDDQRGAAVRELQRELGDGDGARHVLFVGRFEEQKDPLLAIDAIAHLDQPAVRLVLVGEGSLRARMEQRIRSHGLADRIRLVPARGRTDLARLINAADAVVISSAHETGPTIAYEALACGVPLVSTAVGRVPALLAGGAGVVVARRTPDALAEGLRRVLGAPREELARAAVLAAAPYRARAVLAPFYDLHRSLSGS